MSDNITKLGYLAGATRFRRISEKLYIDGDKIYKDSGIAFKASWFSIFYILATAAKPKTVLDLADEIGFSHITVKNVVRELQINGLVKIKPHPTDKRSKTHRAFHQGRKAIRTTSKNLVTLCRGVKTFAGHRTS
jgi:DNA-binding MarR family transcriptional regulator